MIQAPSDESAFESRLTDGTDRFLAHTIEHSLTIGRRTSRDFLRHFPPSAIMEALKDSPSLRADILESATGVKRKVALKKSALSSGEDLQIALDEGEAASDDVVRLLRPDDRVRYLPRGKLWSFIIEGEFWKASKTEKGGYERAQVHIAFLLDRALKDHMVNHQDIVEGISIAKLCLLMPRPELEAAMNSALMLGRKSQPFSDRDLYDALSSSNIVNYIPLTHIWEEVVHPFIAVEHGLSEAVNGPVRVDKSLAQVDKSAAQEEPARPASANSNDAAAPQAQARPSPAKAVSPIAPMKRPGGLAQAMANVVKQAAPAKAAAPVEAMSDDEDGAFEVDFDNLTASKG
jgi:hypothetical protein